VKASGRPAGGYLFDLNRGVEMIGRSFRLPREHKGVKATFASFCLLTKGRGCPVSGKGVLPVIGRHILTNLGVVWPRGQNQLPFVQAAAATTFFRREKGSKTRCSPTVPN